MERLDEEDVNATSTHLNLLVISNNAILNSVSGQFELHLAGTKPYLAFIAAIYPPLTMLAEFFDIGFVDENRSMAATAARVQQLARNCRRDQCTTCNAGPGLAMVPPRRTESRLGGALAEI